MCSVVLGFMYCDASWDSIFGSHLYSLFGSYCVFCVRKFDTNNKIDPLATESSYRRLGSYSVLTTYVISLVHSFIYLGHTFAEHLNDSNTDYYHVLWEIQGTIYVWYIFKHVTDMQVQLRATTATIRNAKWLYRLSHRMPDHVCMYVVRHWIYECVT